MHACGRALRPLVALAPTIGAAALLAGTATVPLIARAQVAGDPNAIGVGQLASTLLMPDAVPFEMWQGTPTLKAHVGEGPEIDIAIDTALPICLASPDFASSRFVTTDGTRDMDLLDRTIRVGKAKPLGIRFDRVNLSGVPFGVLDLPSKLMSSPPKDAPPVWIGTSALAALSFTIDASEQKIYFRPAGSTISPAATTVPFDLKDGRIWIDAKANGKQAFRAMIDTSAVGTLLPAAVAKALKIAPAKTVAFTEPNSKPGLMGALQLDSVALGGLTVNDVQAYYLAEGSKDGLDPELGIIGNDILLRYRVTIDYGTRRLAFEPVAHPQTTAPLPAGAGAAAVAGGTQPGAGGVPNGANTSDAPLPRVNPGLRPPIVPAGRR